MLKTCILIMLSLSNQVLFLKQKSSETQLEFLWGRYLKVNVRYSEVDGQIQSKKESKVNNGGLACI